MPAENLPRLLQPPADQAAARAPATASPADQGEAGAPAWAVEVVALLRELLAVAKAGRHVQAPCENAADLLTMQDLAERTGFSLSTLERMRAAGLLPPALRVGARSIRWRRADVEAWLKQCVEDRPKGGRARRPRKPN